MIVMLRSLSDVRSLETSSAHTDLISWQQLLKLLLKDEFFLRASVQPSQQIYREFRRTGHRETRCERSRALSSYCK